MKRMFKQAYVKNAAQAIETYQHAFGATVLNRVDDPGGAIIHAELDIFGQVLALSDMDPSASATPGNTMQFCIQFNPGEEQVIAQAYQALQQDAAAILFPLGKTFYSESMADLVDRHGVRWCLFI